jgi:hemoglobin
MAQTVFERYGGFSVFSQVVSAFYDKILESPVTSPYFEGTDMRNLIDHQTKFVASVTGGPASYSNDMLQRVHAPLKVSEGAFAEMGKLLKETLEDFGLNEADVKHVCHEIVSRKHFVISGR